MSPTDKDGLLDSTNHVPRSLFFCDVLKTSVVAERLGVTCLSSGVMTEGFISKALPS